MIFRANLKKLLTGLTIPQEYICVGLETLRSQLSVILEISGRKFSQDVTTSHLFLGYKPLIMGLIFNVDDRIFETVRKENKVTLRFLNHEKEISRLSLLKITERDLDDKAVLIFEGEHGVHSFLNPIHQLVNLQRERWKKRAANNVSLPGNLLDQVRIAYSIPRVISIITTSDGALINMFPTDLHGPIGKKFYAGSLRRGGLANEQVEKYKQIVISEVDVTFYNEAYSLGKNHMQHLTTENRFPLHNGKSKVLSFALPKNVIRYRELKQINFFDHGIHRIHLYEVINEQTLVKDKPTLAHIHQYYAQWRVNQGIETQMLLR